MWTIGITMAGPIRFPRSISTARQVAYSRTLPKSGVYTPEIVVDGYAEITGDRGQQLGEAILRAGSIPKANVLLNPSTEKAPGKASFDAKVSQLPPIPKGDELELWVAVTEKGLQSDVKAGENNGETLRHAAVVRSLRKVGSHQKWSGLFRPGYGEAGKELEAREPHRGRVCRGQEVLQDRGGGHRSRGLSGEITSPQFWPSFWGEGSRNRYSSRAFEKCK